MPDTPVKRADPFAGMPRCLARNRRGGLCQRVAGRKGRCRLHGGAEGSGGPWGEENGRYRHGRGTHQAVANCRAVAGILRNLRTALREEIAREMSEEELTEFHLGAPPDRARALKAATELLLPVARADAFAVLLRRSKS